MIDMLDEGITFLSFTVSVVVIAPMTAVVASILFVGFLLLISATRRFGSRRCRTAAVLSCACAATVSVVTFVFVCFLVFTAGALPPFFFVFSRPVTI